MEPDTPIDLQAFVIYSTSLEESIENSYSKYGKVCEVLGKDTISYAEYHGWLQAYYKVDNFVFFGYNRKFLPLPDIRGCILSDVIHGKPLEKCSQDLLTIFGWWSNMKEEDHEYWYKRFSDGKLQITRLKFSDLTDDAIMKVIEKSDLKTSLSLRNVSHRLRNIVDFSKPGCTDIEVKSGSDCVRIEFFNRYSSYFPKYNDRLSRNSLNSENIEIYTKRALGLLESGIKNPKLRLKSFRFKDCQIVKRRNYKTAFLDVLKSLDHQIHVENCEIRPDNEEDIISILQCFKPGTLKKIDLFNFFPKSFKIDKVVELDQWKQAKHIKTWGIITPSIEHFHHFSTFKTYFESIGIEDMLELCDALSKSSNFEYCSISFSKILDVEDLNQVMELKLVHKDDTLETYSIAELSLFIHFKHNVNMHMIMIGKKPDFRYL